MRPQAKEFVFSGVFHESMFQKLCQPELYNQIDGRFRRPLMRLSIGTVMPTELRADRIESVQKRLFARPLRRFAPGRWPTEAPSMTQDLPMILRRQSFSPSAFYVPADTSNHH